MIERIADPTTLGAHLESLLKRLGSSILRQPVMYEPQDHRRDRRRAREIFVAAGQMVIPVAVFTAIVYLLNYMFVFSYALTFGITPEELGFERLAALSRSAVWASLIIAAFWAVFAIAAFVAFVTTATTSLLDKRRLSKPAGGRFGFDHLFGSGRPATLVHGQERTVVTLLPLGSIAATAGACTACVFGIYFLFQSVRNSFFPDDNVYRYEWGWAVISALIFFFAFSALAYLRYLYAFLGVLVVCVTIFASLSAQMGNVAAQLVLSPGCEKVSSELLPIVGLSADRVTVSMAGKLALPDDLTYLGQSSAVFVLTDGGHLYRVSSQGLVTRSTLAPGAAGKHRVGTRCFGY